MGRIKKIVFDNNDKVEKRLKLEFFIRNQSVKTSDLPAL
jgi:hypothetical protein